MAPDQGLSQSRKRIAVIQGVCGILVIASGIVLIPLKAPDGSPSAVLSFSRIIGNVGFGIWGGVIILVTAVTGCIYRKRKTMTAIYASLSLVSIAVAITLISVSGIGLRRFSRYTYNDCDRQYRYYYTDDLDDCCLHRYSYGCSDYVFPYSSRPTDPYKDYESKECQQEREEKRIQEQRERLMCKEKVMNNRSANLAVLSVLCFVSIVDLVISCVAAGVGFRFGCPGCRKTRDHRRDYLNPPNEHPGPMVVPPMHLQVTGMVPKAAQYPPGVAGITTHMSPGSYPYPMHLSPLTGGPNILMPWAMQGYPDPPPKYEE